MTVAGYITNISNEILHKLSTDFVEVSSPQQAKLNSQQSDGLVNVLSSNMSTRGIGKVLFTKAPTVAKLGYHGVETEIVSIWLEPTVRKRLQYPPSRIVINLVALSFERS